jgi:hypothetical protein
MPQHDNFDIKYEPLIREQLLREFDAIDFNHDGFLDKGEITIILDKRSPAQTFDRDILGYLFNQINSKDHHSDDRISKNEFCDTYIQLNTFFHDRINEFEFKNLQIEKVIEEYKGQLAEARDTERKNKFGIMDDSTLTVTVIEGIDLKAMDYNGMSDPYCILQIEDQMERTRTQTNTLNPTWHQEFVFRIVRGNEILKITSFDEDRHQNDKNKEDDFLGQCAVGIDMLRDQQKVEKIIPLQSDNPYESWQGKIKVEMRWIHSVVKLLTDLITEHQNEQKLTCEAMKEYEDKIYKLQKPFWWMDKNQIRELEAGDVESHEYGQDSVMRIAGTVTTAEREFSTKLNGIANPLMSLIGYKEAPWFGCLKILIYIYTILTLLINIMRPDFHNLSICVLSLFFLTMPVFIRRWSFRVITFMIVFTIFYDSLWLILNMMPWWRSEPYDGDSEKTLRQFAIVITFMSMFFRILVFLGFWKASVDYHSIIGAMKGLNGDVQYSQNKSFFGRHLESIHTARDTGMFVKEGYFRK